MACRLRRFKLCPADRAGEVHSEFFGLGFRV